MSLLTITNGQTSDASQLNQLIYVLQRQAGQSETGKYHLGFAAYTNNALGSLYMPSLSRNSTPSGVTIDTADTSPSGISGAVQTDHLTANGFHLYAFSNAANTACNLGGNWTISF